MRFGTKVLLMTVMLLSTAEAAELTIYNQNLALIKSTQLVDLKKGINEVLFEEVARQMRPQSAFIYGTAVKVLEQNYDYAGINYINMLNANIGKEVKTVRENPQTGTNIYEKAILLAVDGMSPVLKFDYGIETNFNGRVVFDSVPFGLNSEPVLKAKVEVSEAKKTELNLAYLSSGFSWQADYVAKVNDDKTISLLGRAAITNNSGSNYENATINLIAGDVNAVQTVMQPRMYKMAMMNTMARGAVMEDAVVEAVMDAPSSLAGYYVYKIPQKTSLKDGQLKQVSFLDASSVKYKKHGVINSTLYFGTAKSFYKDVHPQVVYNFANNADDGLGMPLPQGKVSFYDLDDMGALQFIGENMIDNKAEGQKVTLELGKFFDVYAMGQIKSIKEKGQADTKLLANGQCRSSHVLEYDVVYEVTNKAKKEVNMVLKQSLSSKAKVISETLKGNAGEGDIYEWRFKLSQGETKEIKVLIENVIERGDCRDKIILE